MDRNFEFLTNLEYKVKTQRAQLEAFRSGEKYVAMQKEFRQQLSEKKQQMKHLEQELAQARRATVTMRNNWFAVTGDLEKQHQAELQVKDREIKRLQERALQAEHALDEAQDKILEKTRAWYQVKSELEEEQEKNRNLKTQLHRDFENSTIPSSQSPNHKKIPNSREQTGRKPGGQPGHPGHGRKKQTPTNRIVIPPPAAYTDNPHYQPTGRILTRQLVNLNIHLLTGAYSTPEYRSLPTGAYVHADFPAGLDNDVNYGGSIKALAFLLNSHCCVSLDKVRELLSELTDGQLQLSKGMLSGLTREFSQKTTRQQQDLYADLLCAPVMHTDFTSVRLNGKNAQVAVCATPHKARYFAREHKGHQGVQATPVQAYQGILVHDHDPTFYQYGSGHQECLSHVLRYLKGSMENEPGFTWNRAMQELLRDMIHDRNSWGSETGIPPNQVAEYEARYRQILRIAKDEYAYEPPSDYYKEGYNLYRRLEAYQDSHLLFLHNPAVPTNNNLSERLLRTLKRKTKQVMAFRSFDSLSYLCDSMSMVALLRAQEQNLYQSISSIFD